MMQQPGTTLVPPQMAPPTVPHQQSHFQYQQQQQPWMMPNHHHQQPPQQPPFQHPQPQPPMYYHQQQPPSQAAQSQFPASSDEVHTLWIGDLQYWMDEQYLVNCFAQIGEVVTAKVIRNKQTAQSEGYGFIEFGSRAAAERTLQTYNGTLMPNVEQNYRLNWASFGAGEKRSDGTPDFTIFVGDLASDVTDYMLQETFRSQYPSVKGAKVVTDRMTGRAKGYGFVRFGDESEQLRAMTEMNGKFCSTRPMRVGPAANKKNVGKLAIPLRYGYWHGYVMGCQVALSFRDWELISAEMVTPITGADTLVENNLHGQIFVGGVNESVSDDQLRQVFSPYGQLVHVKIPAGKRCGFVQFADRHCAEEALRMLNGTQLGGQKIRLSWGRSPSSKQFPSVGFVQSQPDPSQWNGGYYGYTPGYETYGYAAAAQDPNLYYRNYPGYGNYQQPPQQQ
ncbi:hypothetical protein TEA_021139 [Camellia sinensis var. sinensis]|uniref:RRM domain-containing protein n=1 Tax=Camellia sinensis var. sinensis TaxID=542762 RepID=A0A4S4E8L5_CAMSN|nr:hypothetical protein TEA_021139 [Camellia sinensis var. sinensis]